MAASNEAAWSYRWVAGVRPLQLLGGAKNSLGRFSYNGTQAVLTKICLEITHFILSALKLVIIN